MYTPNETGLGALQVVEDVRACSRFKTEAERDVCMIGKGYQKTAKGYSRSTGISPKAIVGVAAALAIPALLPVALPAAAGALKAAVPVVKSLVAKGAETPTAAATPAPVVVAPAPKVPPSIAAAALEPWILPGFLGIALILFLALRR